MDWARRGWVLVVGFAALAASACNEGPTTGDETETETSSDEESSGTGDEGCVDEAQLVELEDACGPLDFELRVRSLGDACPVLVALADVGDVDGDGIDDAVFSGPGELAVYLSSSEAYVELDPPESGRTLSFVRLADLDGDEALDLLTQRAPIQYDPSGSPDFPEIGVRWGNGGGELEAWTYFEIEPGSTVHPTTTRAGDGAEQLYLVPQEQVVGSQMLYRLSFADRQLTRDEFGEVGGNPLGFGDFDGDGEVDVMTSEIGPLEGGWSIALRRGIAGGGLEAPVFSAGGMPLTLQSDVADLYGEGRVSLLQVAVTPGTGPLVDIARWSWETDRLVREPVLVGYGFHGFVTGDLDLDGRGEILLYAPGVDEENPSIDAALWANEGSAESWASRPLGSLGSGFCGLGPGRIVCPNGPFSIDIARSCSP